MHVVSGTTPKSNYTTSNTKNDNFLYNFLLKNQLRNQLKVNTGNGFDVVTAYINAVTVLTIQ
jgi:hypothetical protein